MRTIMVPVNKLRILALHGYTQSDVIFNGKLGSLRKGFKKEIEFTFIKAPHKIPLRNDDNEKKEANSSDTTGDADANGYGWWFNTEDYVFKATVPSNLAVGFEESVKLIEKTFRECGPFDGILGFSQGAAFASILCAMQQSSLIQIKFDFAIIISGFKSLCAPHGKYYNENIHIPSLHIYGTNDRVIPIAMTKNVGDLFTCKTEVSHDGGHYIPGKKDIYKNFVANMLQQKAAKSETQLAL